jgi:hypothetical protein
VIGSGRVYGATPGLTGDVGIFCKGAAASIQDDPTATSTVLTVDMMGTSYLDVEDGCTVNLTQGPKLGFRDSAPLNWDLSDLACCFAAGCVGSCSTSCPTPEPTVAGVRVAGGGSVSFGSQAMPGSIVCAGPYGIDLETSNLTGSPTVALNGATIDLIEAATYDNGTSTRSGISCAAAMVAEGSLSASATTFAHAYQGVFVGPNAVTADLSGAGNGGNTFACNDATWGASTYCGTQSAIVLPSSGADVVNATAGVAVDARNATWSTWDATANATQVWSCDDTTYSHCTCSGPNCSAYTSPGAPPDGANAIYLSTNLVSRPLDTRSGSQASATTCP